MQISAANFEATSGGAMIQSENHDRSNRYEATANSLHSSSVISNASQKLASMQQRLEMQKKEQTRSSRQSKYH